MKKTINKDSVRQMVYEEIKRLTEPTGNPDSIQYKVREMLNEEYGVARDVKRAATELKGKIEKYMRDNEPITKYDNGICTYNNGGIDYDNKDDKDKVIVNLSGNEVKVVFNVIDFPNMEIYGMCDKSAFNSGTLQQKGVIILTLGSVNGKIIPEWMESIQHEMHHYYEFLQNGREGTLSDKYRKMYEICIDETDSNIFLYDDNDEEYLWAVLKDVMYRSFDNEINAILNEFEVYVENHCGRPMADIKDISIGVTLKNINEVLNDWEVFVPIAERCFKVKGYICYNLLRNAEERYIRGIARILMGYQKKMRDAGELYIFNLRWYAPWKVFFNELERDIKDRQYQKKN